jgi:hypothetical protein
MDWIINQEAVKICVKDTGHQASDTNNERAFDFQPIIKYPRRSSRPIGPLLITCSPPFELILPMLVLLEPSYQQQLPLHKIQLF